MFGFGDKRTEAVDETERYMRSMFSGLGGDDGTAVPPEALADPYVSGFLQVLTVHSVATVYFSHMPDREVISDIMASALDRLAPGYGAVVLRGIAAFDNPSHPRHAIFMSGRREGSEHVRGLLASDEIARNGHYNSFRDFVAGHYL